MPFSRPCHHARASGSSSADSVPTVFPPASSLSFSRHLPSLRPECIVENRDVEPSVSRNTIKKYASSSLSFGYESGAQTLGANSRFLSISLRFLASHYKLDMSSNANISNLNRAIDSGSEKGIFLLPKGRCRVRGWAMRSTMSQLTRYFTPVPGPSGKIGLNKSTGKEVRIPSPVTSLLLIRADELTFSLART
jgi:hypothetical protein